MQNLQNILKNGLCIMIGIYQNVVGSNRLQIVMPTLQTNFNCP